MGRKSERERERNWQRDERKERSSEIMKGKVRVKGTGKEMQRKRGIHRY